MNFRTTFRAINTWALALMTVMLLCPLALSAQAANDKDKKDKKDADVSASSLSLAVDSGRKATDLPPARDVEENQGENWGGFEVKQAAEFGGRISDFTGSRGNWDTLVNLGTGPRLMEYSLNMRSPNHTGKLFDEFSFSNFGYGGEPNDVSRMTFSKGKIYTFNSSFRRDQNIFDYDLLANPLNPPTSVPNVPILDSPHEFLLTRRMSDLNLGLFPTGNIRFKIGWSRVVNEGTSFTSLHNGTDFELFQPTLNTTDNYSFGVSLRVIPRTAINFDQFFTHFKGDSTAGFSNLPALFTLANGQPVNLGLPFNTAANQPCGGATPPLLANGFANPLCSGLLGYARQNPVRTSYPTEQLSFQSNYFHRLDMSGRFSYSSSDSDSNFNEFFNGLARLNQRQYTQVGSSNAQRISTTADFGMTYRLTDKLHLVDTFRYDNFRIPTGWSYTNNNLFGANLLANPIVFNPANCRATATVPATLLVLQTLCPQHVATSVADIIVDSLNQFLKQESKINTVEVEYQFTPRVSAFVGYRFERREITNSDSDFQISTFFPGGASAAAGTVRRGGCATVGGVLKPLNADGSCTIAALNPAVGGSDFTEINGQSAIFGFTARPTNKIRLSFDTEQYYADNTFTRISPRHLQRYKGKISFKPLDWWNVGASVNIRENRNNVPDVENLQHNRSFALNTTFAPSEGKWGIDLGYSYNDIFSQTNICFVATPVPSGVTQQSCQTAFLSGLSTYTETSHVGSGSIYFKPISRVAAAVGYTVTSSNGTTVTLDPLAPTGPLAFNYHLPTASLVVQMAKNLAFKSGWNYYGYNEKSAAGPTLPRDFRGNSFTLSLRYSM